MTARLILDRCRCGAFSPAHRRPCHSWDREAVVRDAVEERPTATPGLSRLGYRWEITYQPDRSPLGRLGRSWPLECERELQPWNVEAAKSVEADLVADLEEIHGAGR